jgi:hypothetical protein
MCISLAGISVGVSITAWSAMAFAVIWLESGYRLAGCDPLLGREWRAEPVARSIPLTPLIGTVKARTTRIRGNAQGTTQCRSTPDCWRAGTTISGRIAGCLGRIPRCLRLAGVGTDAGQQQRRRPPSGRGHGDSFRGGFSRQGRLTQQSMASYQAYPMQRRRALCGAARERIFLEK